MGDGRYQIQPLFVGDLASIAIATANDKSSAIIDAIGPESYSFIEFVKTISKAIGKKPFLIKTPPRLGLFLGRVIGLYVRDVILTDEELKGLMSNLLTSRQKPNGPTKFSEWIKQYSSSVGRAYSSELDRHFRWSYRDTDEVK